MQITKEVQENVTASEEMFLSSKTFAIKTQDDHKNAAVCLRDIKKKHKDLEGQRKEMTRPLDESKKKVMDFFRGPLGWLKDAEATIKREIIRYQTEQERIRMEHEKKIQEEARAKAKKEAEKLKKKAEKEEQKGNMEKADELREQAEDVPVVVPTVPKQVEKQQGISAMQEVWKFRVVDIGILPQEYLMPNEKAIGQVVKALKDKALIPGVEVYSEKSISVRT